MIIDITGPAQLQTCQEFGKSMGHALHFRLRKVTCESAGRFCLKQQRGRAGRMVQTCQQTLRHFIVFGQTV